jgi:hypothetical protein
LATPPQADHHRGEDFRGGTIPVFHLAAPPQVDHHRGEIWSRRRTISGSRECPCLSKGPVCP